MNDILKKHSVGGGGIPYHDKGYAFSIMKFHVIMHITELWTNSRR